MPKPVSNEIREKIVTHKQNGVTESNIAKWLIISKSTVTKVWSLFQRSGSYEPLPLNCGRKALVGDDTMAKIIFKINEEPDITLLELVDEFSLHISEAAMSKRLKKVGLTFKKRHSIRTDKNAKTSLKSVRNGKKASVK